MYGGSSHLNVGMAPVALAGLAIVDGNRLLWFLMAASVPLAIVLIIGTMLLNQELTEAEAMVVEELAAEE